jgi:hypothetical protein
MRVVRDCGCQDLTVTSLQRSKLGAEQYLMISHNAQFHWQLCATQAWLRLAAPL